MVFKRLPRNVFCSGGSSHRLRPAAVRFFSLLSFVLLGSCPLVIAAPGPQQLLDARPHIKETLDIAEGNDIHFESLSRTSGLSQTRVAEITQDHQGFMWLGTQNGLNRYDGYRFKVFRNDPLRPDSLSGAYIRSLFTDRHGDIWVGCDQVLNRFDPVSESFAHYYLVGDEPGGSSPTVNQIRQDSTQQTRLDPADL